MSKTLNQVKLNVNFTAISPSSNMSNIASDDNISNTLAKIHHWYVKTNGFQASSSPLVSTSNDGIVTTLPSTTGGFLKNTGTAGGAWTKLGDADIPNTIVRKTGNTSLTGRFEPSYNGGADLGRDIYRFYNIYGTHLFGTDFNGFTIEKSVPSDAVFTDTIPSVDSALSSSSTNPVQNKVIKESLDSKVDKISGKGLSTNDFTTEEKNKLSNLENYDDSDLRKWVNEESGYGKITILETNTAYDNTSKELVFYFRMIGDAFQEMKQIGLIATTNAAIKYQLTLDTPPETGVTYVKTTETSAGVYEVTYYHWTKTNVNPGDTWYVVPYMKYDSGDDSYLKYGPLYSVTANSDSTVSITTISPAPSNVMYDVLHPSNFTLTKQSSVSTDTITYTARCIGNIVIINICIQTSKAWTASGNKGIATIPISYRPSITYVTGDVMVSGTYESARAWIDASTGQLQMKYDFEIPANATITMAFAYSIGDTATAS